MKRNLHKNHTQKNSKTLKLMLMPKYPVDSKWLKFVYSTNNSKCNTRVTLHKKWSFLLRISSANMMIPTGNFGCVTFTEAIFNKKLLFLGSVSKYHNSLSLNSCVYFFLIFINSIYHTLLLSNLANLLIIMIIFCFINTNVK